MPRPVKFVLVAATFALAALPVTLAVTFLLYPLWSWIETTYAIESVGHSGPADWCFGLVYGILITVAVAALTPRWRNPAGRGKSP